MGRAGILRTAGIGIVVLSALLVWVLASFPLHKLSHPNASASPTEAPPDPRRGPAGRAGTVDTDAAFALMMVEHYDHGYDLAQHVVDHGRDLQLRAIAQRFLDSRQREQPGLKDWLIRHGQPVK